MKTLQINLGLNNNPMNREEIVTLKTDFNF